MAGPADPQPVPQSSAPAPSSGAFVAVLRVDADTGATSRGVWLERPEGDRWTIAKSPGGLWTAFDGRQVHVTGEIMPSGPGVADTPFRVDSLRFEHEMPVNGVVAVGPEVELTGRIVERRGEPGTKTARGSWTALVTEDASYVVENSADVALSEVPVDVKGRVVELSPFVAHMGPRIWILGSSPSQADR